MTVATGGRLNLLSSQTVDGNILNNGIIDVTGNALVTQPLAYEAFYERLVTGFGGAQFAAMLTPAMGARAGLGAEVDFSRSANNYSGVSQIPGLPAFSLAHGGAWNGARPAANGGLFYNIAPNQRVFLNGATGQQAYTSRGYASGMLGYQAAF